MGVHGRESGLPRACGSKSSSHAAQPHQANGGGTSGDGNGLLVLLNVILSAVQRCLEVHPETAIYSGKQAGGESGVPEDAQGGPTGCENVR